MFKIKRITALVLTTVLLLGVMLVTSGCSQVKLNDVKQDPDGQVKESLRLTLDTLKASGSSSPLAYIAKTFEKGAFTVKYGDAETAAFTNTLYIDAAAGAFADAFTMEFPDEKHEATLYFDKENLAVKLPAQAGGTTIGLNFATVMSDMKDADAFWALTGMTYEDFEAEFGGMLKAITAEGKDSGLIEMFKLKAALDKAKKILDDCDAEVENKKIVAGAEDVKAINVTYTMTTEELNSLVDVFGEWFNGNWESVIRELIGELPPEFTTDSVSTEVTAAIDELKAMLTETKANVRVTFSINPSNGLLMKAEGVFETTIDEQKEYVTINVDLGKDLRQSSEYQINFITSSGIESAASKITIGYQRKDSSGMYHRRAYCVVQGDDVDKTVEFTLKWNTASEVYTAEFDSVDTNIVISGEAGVKGDALWLTVDELSVNRENREIGLHLEFDPGTKVPAMPNYTNIADLSESDWEKLTALMDRI